MKSSLQIQFSFPEHNRIQTIKKTTFVQCSETFLNSMHLKTLLDSFLAQGKIIGFYCYIHISQQATSTQPVIFTFLFFRCFFFLPNYKFCGILQAKIIIV